MIPPSTTHRRIFTVAASLLAVAACSSSSGTNDAPGDGGSGDATLDDGAPGADAEAPILGQDSGGPGPGPDDGGVFNDGAPDVIGIDGCVVGDAGVAPFPRRCSPATTNECDTATDTFLASQAVPASLKNAVNGNGYDDDCDGLVDEGCPCAGNGHADSPASACLGWSSKRQPPAPDAGTFKQGCINPRLDKDNVTCDPAIDDPTVLGSLLARHFCAPENVNVDNPGDNDQFVIGVNHFQSYGGSPIAHPHVNLFCNGVRVLSAGYNPVTGQAAYPALTQIGATPGADTTGDGWVVATVRAHVTAGALTSCDVVTIPSHNPDPTRDGPLGTQLVESKNNASSPAWSYLDHRFVDHTALQSAPNGTIPALPAGFCKH